MVRDQVVWKEGKLDISSDDGFHHFANTVHVIIFHNVLFEYPRAKISNDYTNFRNTRNSFWNTNVFYKCANSPVQMQQSLLKLPVQFSEEASHLLWWLCMEFESHLTDGGEGEEGGEGVKWESGWGVVGLGGGVWVRERGGWEEAGDRVRWRRGIGSQGIGSQL